MIENEFHLPHDFEIRPYQRHFFEAMASGIKRACLVWHRRAGKEMTCWNYLIMQAAMKRGTYFYFFPSFAQGRKILWSGMNKEGRRFLDYLPNKFLKKKPNSTNMQMELRNGSIIQIIGTDNIDSIVGTNPIGCVFSEYSLQNRNAWTFISPVLAENKGWAVFNFTPRGCNHAKDLYDNAIQNPEWFCQRLTVDDTDGAITKDDIERARADGMSEDYIQQEFYCSFTLGVEGAYYAKYLQDCRDEGRIGYVPWDRQQKVYTSWDIGYGDSTSIIFYQLVGNEVHIIDYYENHGEGLPHYAKIVLSKPCLYAAHYAPHDIDSHSFTSGLSARQVGLGLGIKFTTLPTLKVSHEEGVEAVRGIFPRVFIDKTKCDRLIKCLENYRKEYDQRLECYKERPRHDWASHGADAMRYLAIAVKLYSDRREGSIDDRQSENWYKQFNPRFD